MCVNGQLSVWELLYWVLQVVTRIYVMRSENDGYESFVVLVNLCVNTLGMDLQLLLSRL